MANILHNLFASNPRRFVDNGFKHKQVRTSCFSWSSPVNRLVSSRSRLSNDVTCPDKAWPKTRRNVTSLTKLTRRTLSQDMIGQSMAKAWPKKSKNSHFQNEAKCKMAVFLLDVKVVMRHFMSETSKSSGVKTGRRKGEDSSEKTPDFS